MTCKKCAVLNQEINYLNKIIFIRKTKLFRLIDDIEEMLKTSKERKVYNRFYVGKLKILKNQIKNIAIYKLINSISPSAMAGNKYENKID